MNATVKFISILKNKIYKYETAISKNIYIGKFAELVAECSNTVHRNVTTLFIEQSK